jgi:hypothetical protein
MEPDDLEELQDLSDSPIRLLWDFWDFAASLSTFGVS